MKIQTIIYSLCMVTLLSSCHIYKQYDRPDIDMKGLYRDPVAINDTLVSDTNNMANLPWEKVFYGSLSAIFDSFGVGEKCRFADRFVESTGSQSEPDDFAFVVFTFTNFSSPGRSK